LESEENRWVVPLNLKAERQLRLAEISNKDGTCRLKCH
jgi:hypothetical protein